MALRLLILFIALPIIELFLLIKIGGVIGFFPTIALVILTAVIGSQLVRRQGLTVLARIRESQARGEMPALPMLDGAALLHLGAHGVQQLLALLVELAPRLRDLAQFGE